MNYQVCMMAVPLENVETRCIADVRRVVNPVFSGDGFTVSPREYSLTVPGTGRFFACNGREAEYQPETGADADWVRFYLNNQVLVALLHQRKIVNFHASSFIHDGRGVTVLGETGAGKSSLAVAFAMAGAGFLTDDLTPIVLINGNPHIRPLHREIKLRLDTVRQLGLEEEGLRDAENGTGKKYLAMNPVMSEDHPLDCILRMEVGDVPKPLFIEPSPSEKFALLRGEICMSEILAGMPETEAVYLQQLLNIIGQVKFIRVIRPAEIRIIDLQRAVEDFLGRKVKG